MAIRRSKRQRNFSIISNVAINDDRLSLRARGLLVWMLAKPDDWVFHESEMVKHWREGRDATRSARDELEKAGYLVISQNRGDVGKFGNKSWILFDEPQSTTNAKNADDAFAKKNSSDTNAGKSTFSPQTENPSTANPLTADPSTANPQLLSTDGTKNLSLPRTNGTELKDNGQSDGEPSLTDRFAKLWQAYPRKRGKKIAETAYRSAVRKGVTDEDIMTGIENYKREIEIKNIGPDYIKHGGTWFKQQLWTDDYDTEPAAVGYDTTDIPDVPIFHL